MDNAQEFMDSAEDNIKKNRHNAAVSDYFKAIVIYCDYIIYSDRKSLPKNHSDRFEILEKYYPEIYSIVSKLFRKYTDSYNLKSTKTDVSLMRENAIKVQGIAKNKK